MSDLHTLTRQYVSAFGARDLPAVAALLDDHFALEDPAGRFEGKAAVTEYIQGIFASVTDLRFEAASIFVDGETSIVEFNLEIGGKHLTGVDIIEWQDGRMKELRAYLYEKPAAQ